MKLGNQMEPLFEQLQNGGLADQRVDKELAWLVLRDDEPDRVIEREGMRFVRYKSQDVPFDDWFKEVGKRYTGSLDDAVTLYPEIPVNVPSNPSMCCADALAHRMRRKPHFIWRFIRAGRR